MKLYLLQNSFIFVKEKDIKSMKSERISTVFSNQYEQAVMLKA